MGGGADKSGGYRQTRRNEYDGGRGMRGAKNNDGREVMVRTILMVIPNVMDDEQSKIVGEAKGDRCRI